MILNYSTFVSGASTSTRLAVSATNLSINAFLATFVIDVDNANLPSSPSTFCKSCNRLVACSVRQSMKITYKGTTLGSTYELAVVKDLELNNIVWTTCDRIKYKSPDGKERTYTPDIYLPDFNIYLDPKNDFLIENINPRLGFKDIDKIKWVCEQNNIRVFVLNKNQLNWDYIKDLI